MSNLSTNKIGVSVQCKTCYMQKCPRGRSAPPSIPMCDFECDGYNQHPLVGDLWPGESEADFGYPVSDNGTHLLDG
jgi:hypothetical protein